MGTGVCPEMAGSRGTQLKGKAATGTCRVGCVGIGRRRRRIESEPAHGAFPGGRVIFIGAGSTTIEMVTRDEWADSNAGNWQHLAFEVASVDAAHAELTAKRVAFHPTFMSPVLLPEQWNVRRAAEDRTGPIQVRYARGEIGEERGERVLLRCAGVRGAKDSTGQRESRRHLERQFPSKPAVRASRACTSGGNGEVVELAL